MKFRIALNNLQDCYDSLWESLSGEEYLARQELIALCHTIANDTLSEELIERVRLAKRTKVHLDN